MIDRQQLDQMTYEEINQKIEAGELALTDIDEYMQQRRRREAAEREDRELPDSTDRVTASGFGSGQGMGNQETGQDPDRPPERGFPRTEDPEWPH